MAQAYSDPALWEHSKAMARDALGGHSARAMQMAGKIYRAAGGRYLSKPTKAQQSLKRWTAQDWGTKSGKPSRETGERYLPRAALEGLTSQEYAATTRAKRKGTAAGQQFVKQPQRIAAKVAALKGNPTMKKKPSPAQLAARARFAEMARSGAFKRKAAAAKKAAPKRKKTVSQKISQLIHEGYPQKQAVAVALSEQRAGKVKATPRKRNPITETLIYGLPAGETRDYMEELLYGGGLKLTPEQIQKVLAAATDAGYHSFRVTGFDPTVGAEFVRTMGQGPKRKRNPATGRKGSGTKLNPKPRMAKIAWFTPGGQREVIEVPIDFAFKEYIGNIQEDFFARTDNGFLVVTEKSTGMKVGQVPPMMRASALNDRTAAKRFVQSIVEKVGAPGFRAAIAKHPRIM